MSEERAPQQNQGSQSGSSPVEQPATPERKKVSLLAAVLIGLAAVILVVIVYALLCRLGIIGH
jgi:hypothetical protein